MLAGVRHLQDDGENRKRRKCCVLIGMVPTAKMLRQFYPSAAPPHKYLGTMRQEEMYAKAEELGIDLKERYDYDNGSGE